MNKREEMIVSCFNEGRDLTLWAAVGYVPLCVINERPHEMTDDEAEAVGLEIY